MAEDDEIESAVPIHEMLSVRNDRSSKFYLAFAVLAFSVAVVLFAVGFVMDRAHHKTWNPLGPYPVQIVTNPQHMVPVDGAVDVVARKCSKDKEVTVRATKEWIPVNDSPAAVADNTAGLFRRYPSCGPTPTATVYRYRNKIPPAVVRLVKQGQLRVWRISGTDTPFDKEGRQGVPRTWTTQTFLIR